MDSRACEGLTTLLVTMHTKGVIEPSANITQQVDHSRDVFVHNLNVPTKLHSNLTSNWSGDYFVSTGGVSLTVNQTGQHQGAGRDTQYRSSWRIYSTETGTHSTHMILMMLSSAWADQWWHSQSITMHSQFYVFLFEVSLFPISSLLTQFLYACDWKYHCLWKSSLI